MCQVHTLSSKQGADLPCDRNYETFHLTPVMTGQNCSGQEAVRGVLTGNIHHLGFYSQTLVISLVVSGYELSTGTFIADQL